MLPHFQKYSSPRNKQAAFEQFIFSMLSKYNRDVTKSGSVLYYKMNCSNFILNRKEKPLEFNSNTPVTIMQCEATRNFMLITNFPYQLRKYIFKIMVVHVFQMSIIYLF